jgi:hypothetical protein
MVRRTFSVAVVNEKQSNSQTFGTAGVTRAFFSAGEYFSQFKPSQIVSTPFCSTMANENATTAAANVVEDTSTSTTTKNVEMSSKASDEGPVGCYLSYESGSSGCLMLTYSLGIVPPNAVGFWQPGPGESIQKFKFSANGGRSELIKGIAGGDSNRRRYYVGWAQFLKLCKAKHGSAIQFTPEQGVEVDVYAYNNRKSQPEKLHLDDGLVNLDGYDSIAVMPKHHSFLEGVKKIGSSSFLERGNIAGASTLLK